MVYDFVRSRLKHLPAEARAYLSKRTAKAKIAPLSPRQGAWLIVSDPFKLNLAQLQQLWKLLGKSEEVVRLYSLAQNFREMLMGSKIKQWGLWLEEAKQSGLAQMVGFASGLERDEQAVKAAIISEFSNAQTEGQVTRIKFIRRSMYGRGKFDLLRVRVLGKVA